MTYSLDLRERAVNYVRKGGTRAEASRLYSVHPDTIRNWLARANLSPSPSKSRNRKIDRAALAAHVKAHPHALLRERAAHFGVHVHAIWYQLKQMDLVKKTA